MRDGTITDNSRKSGTLGQISRLRSITPSAPDPACTECGESVLAAGLCRACRNHREVLEVSAENRRLRDEIADLANVVAHTRELSPVYLITELYRIARGNE